MTLHGDRPGGWRSMTRILVTGGAGYVGSVSVEALLAAGHEVVVLDDLTTGHAAAVPPGVTLLRQDYGDLSATTAALREHRVEAILHVAARSVVPESVRDPARYYRQNVAGGIALLEAARATDVQRIVFSSTAAVYGTPEVVPIPEDAPLRPINPYGETKRTFEGALFFYGQAYGLRSVSLRYFNAAGASHDNGEDHNPETHLIPNVLRAVQGRGPVTIFGDDYPTPDGTPIRDYIHVLDLADAHVRALDATGRDARQDAPEGGSHAIVCNLGTGTGFSPREILAATEAVVGLPVPVQMGPRRPGDAPMLVATVDRARDVLGWTAQRSTLAEMIGSAWEWRQRHPDGYETAPSG
jgi:UDP-glucose 4-epimerase